ncbi:histidine phosphotransferase ChpT [Roseovarius nanhaiticus]|uniref:Histidine phosphotransferase ChpT n=1 Tax=Roseovarius nanhaiticus TaxID=573024 RepID=A0A1N7HH38_9RHOB|nr:histidine phosphotransferase family protein [Roseovarius nanhaiticus]SEK94943.1 histidine phosphotransferase ChpT [Roseovarius nanhaiticus]SIS24093.1 histidine phosphotransferase ChpT [Roseovarius nanhaiticus]
MTQPNRNLAALIGSRICHDLISPVGAISNGLELLGMAGVPDGPEMALVADSAANANARLRFFRVAFGLTSEGQSMAEREMRGIVDGVYTAKIACDWQVPGALPRQMAQAAFLAILCAEQAIPYGGTIRVEGGADALRITAIGDRAEPKPEYWARLTAPEPLDVDDLPAAQVQFALLPGLLAEMGRRADVQMNGSVSVSF